MGNLHVDYSLACPETSMPAINKFNSIITLPDQAAPDRPSVEIEEACTNRNSMARAMAAQVRAPPASRFVGSTDMLTRLKTVRVRC
jgi:hypothetical protein